MPNVILKPMSYASNQYFKHEKESNNHSIKRNVYIPGKRNYANQMTTVNISAGSSTGGTISYGGRPVNIGHGMAGGDGGGGVYGVVGVGDGGIGSANLKNVTKCMNVFERLSRTPNRPSARLRGKADSSDRGKLQTPLGRQQNQIVRRAAGPGINLDKIGPQGSIVRSAEDSVQNENLLRSAAGIGARNIGKKSPNVVVNVRKKVDVPYYTNTRTKSFNEILPDLSKVMKSTTLERAKVQQNSKAFISRKMANLKKTNEKSQNIKDNKDSNNNNENNNENNNNKNFKNNNDNNNNITNSNNNNKNNNKIINNNINNNNIKNNNKNKNTNSILDNSDQKFLMNEKAEAEGSNTKSLSESYSRLKSPTKGFLTLEDALERLKSPSPPNSTPSGVTPRYGKYYSVPGHMKEYSSTESISNGNTSLLPDAFSDMYQVPAKINSVDSIQPSAIQVQSKVSIDSNIITENVQDILSKKNAQISESDIFVLKNVVKSDHRAARLRSNDSSIFKDILKTQLKDILKQEQVVATTLGTLDKNLPKRFHTIIDKPILNRLAKSQEKEMSSYIEQVPLLEKEIILLRTLGERLEFKLSGKRAEKISVSTSVTDLKLCRKRAWNCKILKPKLNSVQYVCHQIGWKYDFGTVQEFHIAKKTLHELKQEAEKNFYVTEHCELKCTNFEKLKQNPQILKRYLQPKNPDQTFNILDHDPLLFKDNPFTSVDEETIEPNKSIDSESLYILQALKPSIYDNSNNNINNSNHNMSGGEASFGYLKHKNLDLSLDGPNYNPSDHSKDALNFITQAMEHIHDLDSDPITSTTKCDEKPTGEIPSSLKTSFFEDHTSDPKSHSPHRMLDLHNKNSSFNGHDVDDNDDDDDDDLGVQHLEELVDVSISKIESAKKSQRTSNNMDLKAHRDRRKNHRQLAPLQLDDERIGPKNTLIRLTIMATVQITMLFIVVAAFAFPDWTCK